MIIQIIPTGQRQNSAGGHHGACQSSKHCQEKEILAEDHSFCTAHLSMCACHCIPENVKRSQGHPCGNIHACPFRHASLRHSHCPLYKQRLVGEILPPCFLHPCGRFLSSCYRNCSGTLYRPPDHATRSSMDRAARREVLA